MSERTPAGGDRSEITYFGPDGHIVTDPDDAVEAEIREYAGDILIARSYMAKPDPATLPAYTPPGEVLAEPDVSDTTKNTWGVYDNEDGLYRLANTTASLLHAVGLDHAPEAKQHAFLTNLLKLPSWKAAPLELKQDVTHWLASH